MAVNLYAVVEKNANDRTRGIYCFEKVFFVKNNVFVCRKNVFVGNEMLFVR